jgi:hypothetical protein
MTALWTSFQIAGRIARHILAILRMIPFVNDAVDSVQKTLLNSIVTRFIQSTADSDLDEGSLRIPVENGHPFLLRPLR